MEKEQAMTEGRELVKSVAEESFKKAQERCPYFTQMLLLWAQKEGFTDALTEFISCFVASAVNSSLNYVLRGMEKASKEAEEGAKDGKQG